MTARMTLALQPERDAELLLAQAIAWAERLDLQLDLVTVVPMTLRNDPLHLTGDAQDVAEGSVDTQRLIGEWLDTMHASIPAPRRGTAHLLPGEPVPEILRHVKHGVLAVGTHHRRDLSRLFLGSVSEKIARRAELPVLVLPIDAAPVAHEPLRVHLPVDPADPDLTGVAWAKDHLPHAALTAVFRLSWVDTFTSSDDDAYADAGRTLREVLDRSGHGDVPGLVVVREEPNDGDAIAAEAAVSAVDLLVLPTHGRTGLAHLLLGSTAERVVRAASCPVVVLPGSAPG